MNLKRLKSLLLKESLQIFRDSSSILIAFVLPLILLFLMGYAVSLDANKTPISIVSNSSSKDASTLLNSFMGSKYFVVNISKNLPLEIDNMQKGKIKAILHIDENFGVNNQYNIQLLLDGTEPNGAGLTQNYIGKVVQLWAKNSNLIKEEAIKIVSRYWFNPPMLSRYSLIPGSIAIVMTLIGTLLTALIVAREWERGTMEAIMATPASISEIILGKLIPYYILGMLSMLLCFVVAYFWYEIPFLGSFFMLLVLSSIYLISSLLIGLTISTLAKNQFVAAQIALIAGFLPSFLLSGFLFEIGNMPYFLQALTLIIPARYFVEALQTIFLVGDVYEIFIVDIIAMLFVSLLFFIIILRKLKKDL